MSMNRVIHAAVRRDLHRFEQALASFPTGDADRAAALHRAWRNLHGELTRHHESEHRVAWPRLAALGVSEELLGSMDLEHDAMAAGLIETGVVMARLRDQPTAECASAALRSVRTLRQVTVAHLEHEEEELEEIYLTHRDSPEMREMGREFGRVGPVVGGQFFAWLLDGAGPVERATVAATVPRPVLAVVNGLFGRGYRREIAPVWRA